MDLNDYILKAAQANGICEEWAKRISMASNADELLQMYVNGIDFCMEKDFPSRQDLVSLAGNSLADYGICVDKEGLALKNPKFAVLLGECNAEMHYGEFTVAQAFVRHTSAVEVAAWDNSFVVIDCFDESSMNVESYGNAKVLVNVYGEAKVNRVTNGNSVIKIVHKNKSTY